MIRTRSTAMLQRLHRINPAVAATPTVLVLALVAGLVLGGGTGVLDPNPFRW